MTRLRPLTLVKLPRYQLFASFEGRRAETFSGQGPALQCNINLIKITIILYKHLFWKTAKIAAAGGASAAPAIFSSAVLGAVSVGRNVRSLRRLILQKTVSSRGDR